MTAHSERAAMLAARVAKLVALRKVARADRKVCIVLFNFPPNAGNTGTAAYLSVFASLHRTLLAMKADGYTIDVPATVDELRERIIAGNAERLGATANVHARIGVDDHVRRERWLDDIEATWGPAPGRQQSDGRSIHILGERFGNVFVGIQPAFGYEGDPMRLLFEKGFAPTHAFSAFYRYVREDFGAHAVLHFGTHGALEFMPGKQTGMAASCWPDRLIGDLPNLYLYAANNPSEGAIAKRRAAATLISYLTPPVAHSGLYQGLLELKHSVQRWRSLEPDAHAERAELAALIQAQAALIDLAPAEPAWGAGEEAAHRAPRRQSAGDRIHADPEWAPRRRRVPFARATRRHAARRGRGILRRASGTKRDRSAGRRRSMSPSDSVTGDGWARPTAHDARASWRRSTGCSHRTTRFPRCCARSTAGSRVPRRAAICCARRRSCPQAATSTASTRSAFRATSRCRTARGRRHA